MNSDLSFGPDLRNDDKVVNILNQVLSSVRCRSSDSVSTEDSPRRPPNFHREGTKIPRISITSSCLGGESVFCLPGNEMSGSRHEPRVQRPGLIHPSARNNSSLARGGRGNDRLSPPPIGFRRLGQAVLGESQLTVPMSDGTETSKNRNDLDVRTS